MSILHQQSAGFEIGALITGTHDGATLQAVVLDKAEDSGRLLLMSIGAGEAFEVEAADVKDWAQMPLPMARWVEVYDGAEEAPFFAAYLPDIQAAVAVYRAFEAREGEFRVEIFTNDEKDNALLDGIGYFGNGA